MCRLVFGGLFAFKSAASGSFSGSSVYMAVAGPLSTLFSGKCVGYFCELISVTVVAQICSKQFIQLCKGRKF